MATLFKYCPPSRLDVFAGNKIRLSQPSAFNDPHDGFVTILSRLEERSGGTTRRTLDDFHNERMASGIFTNDLSRRIGVISMTDDPLNPLMWAHYGESHTGFCVHFNQSGSFFQRSVEWTIGPERKKQRFDRLPYPSKVIYVDQRQIFYLEDGVPWDMLFRKASPWAYEREYRSVMNLSDGVVLPETKSHEWPVYLAEIPIDTICGVTIGLLASENLRGEVLRSAAERGVPAFNVRMDHLSFDLVQVPI